MTQPRRPMCSWPSAALRTAALRKGFGNEAGGGQDLVNQACKGSGRVRDGAQQNVAKVAGSMREGEDKPKRDQENDDWVNRVRWEGRGTAEGGDSVVYSSVTLEEEGGEEHKVMAGTMLLVRHDREDRSVAHLPSRVLHLAKRPRSNDELAGPGENGTEEELAGPNGKMTRDKKAGPDGSNTKDELAGPNGDVNKDELAGPDVNVTKDEQVGPRTSRPEFLVRGKKKFGVNFGL